jgi:Methane oxygenase PmoA
VALKELHQGHVPADRLPPGSTIATLVVGDVVVARYCDGQQLPAVLAPRPFLHPVTTLAGVPVTDEQPDDHRWHLGISVTLQDVGGANVWGGRTYLRDQGYVWRPDHGRQVHGGWTAQDPSGFGEQLAWLGPDGRRLLDEERSVSAAPSDLPGAWLLDLATTLTNATGEPLALGSPATNGRPGAGYGGLFWRLPRVEGARVRSSTAEGEDVVHGSLSPWVAVTAGTDSAPFTVALAARDEVTRRDPWFVRLADYPGLGSQLAAVDPVHLAPGASTARSFRALVADGMLSTAEITRALGDRP